MSEFMAFLAENYQLGILTISGVFIFIYLLISILAIKRMYKLRNIIPLGGMIPIIHIIYFFKGSITLKGNKPKLEKEVVKSTQETENTSDDEIIDDMF